jgi:hypothetical protein
MTAAESLNEDMIGLLIDAGADAEVKNDNGQQASGPIN